MGPKQFEEQRRRESEPEQFADDRQSDPTEARCHRKARRRAHLREYGRLIWPFRWPVVGLFGVGVIAAMMDMIFPYLFGFVVDMLAAEGTERGEKVHVLNLVCGGTVLVLVVSRLVDTYRFYATLGLNSKVVVILRRRLHRRLMRLGLGDLQKLKMGAHILLTPFK